MNRLLLRGSFQPKAFSRSVPLVLHIYPFCTLVRFFAFVLVSYMFLACIIVRYHDVLTQILNLITSNNNYRWV